MNIRHRILSYLLAFIVLLSGTIQSPLFSYASRTEYKPHTFYYLLVGVQYVYNKDYNTPATIRENITIPVSDEIPTDARNFRLLSAEPYNFSNPQCGEFTSNTNPLRSTSSWTKQSFKEAYYKYTSNSMSKLENSISYSGRNMSYSFTANQKGRLDLEVYSYLREEGESKLDQLLFTGLGSMHPLLGDESIYATNFPKEYEALEVAKANCATDTKTKLYLVFTPTICKFYCEIPVVIPNGTLTADLTVPSKVKTNTNFDVVDATIISDDIAYETGVLERKIGSGAYQTIATWNGNGSNGVNSGQKKTESIAEEGTVTYKLTVTANSGQSSSCEKTVTVSNVLSANVDAKLILPTSAYEGHPVIAEDDSSVIVEGEEYGAERALMEYIVRHSFSSDASHYTNRKLDVVSNELTFADIGTHSVTLNISGAGRDSDTKNIDILRTPSITATLSGEQKQNRKQILTADVALNPNYPISSYRIEIKDKRTNETVILTSNDPQENTDNIKTRTATVTTDTNGCYAHIKVEFFTKKPEYVTGPSLTKAQYEELNNAPFEYIVTVKDTRNYSDTERKDFTVKSDEPPVAKISVEDNFIREKGTNLAKISVQDISDTDGDSLERTWGYASADPKTDTYTNSFTSITTGSLAYADKSFGTKQNITFGKEGVGKVKLKLTVKDIIPENETLIEYLTESDYKTSTTTAETTVTNIAPSVTLEPIDAVNAKVYLYGDKNTDMAALNQVSQSLNDLKNELLPEGVFLDTENISNRDLSVSATQTGRSYRYGSKEILKLYSENHPYTGGNNNLWHNNYYSGDEDSIYVLNPNYVLAANETSYNYASYGFTFPFTVTAYNLNNATVRWTTTVTQSLWGTSSINLGGPVPYNESDYFLLRTGDSTLVYQKTNGAFLVSLPFVVGDYVWQKNGKLYTIKSDGLYRIDASTSNTSKLYSGNILDNPKKLNGKLWFLDSKVSLKLIMFDFVSERTSSNEFLYQDGFTPTDVRCAGIDSDGKIAVFDGKKLHVFKDASSRPIFTSQEFSTIDIRPFVVHNVDDVIKYVGIGGISRISGGGRVRCIRKADIYDITTGKVLNYETESVCDLDYSYPVDEIGYPPNFARFIDSWEYGNGEVYVATGFSNSSTDSKAPPTKSKVASALEMCFNFNNNTIEDVAQNDFPFSIYSSTAGRNMGTYFISVTNWTYPNSVEDGERGLSVVTLPKTQPALENIAVSDNIEEKEPSGVNKAYVITARELTEKVKTKVKNLGYTIISSFENAAEQIKNAIKEKSENTNAILVTKSGNNTSSLSREIKLEPKKEYFYEYSIVENSSEASITDNLSVKENIKSFKADNGLNYLNEETGYVVTDIISEDYKKEDVNSFFTYSGGSHYFGGWIFGVKTFTESVHVNSRDFWWERGGGITFTIPEGKKAILEVKYSYDKWKSGRDLYSQDFISASIDGKYWRRNDADYNYRTMYGTRYYIHSYIMNEWEGSYTTDILSEGTHTYNMTGLAATPCFESLKLIFIEPKSSMPGSGFLNGDLSLSSSVNSQNGLKTATGSFETSCVIFNYSSQRGTIDYPRGTNYGVFNVSPSENNENIVLGKCFSDNKGFIAVEDKTFDGLTTLTLSSSAPSWYLTNFKLYYKENGKKIYLINEEQMGRDNLTKWTVNGGMKSFTTYNRDKSVDENAPLIYKKGEAVTQRVNFSDYENDPKKKDYWFYTHLPYNDGAHSKAAIVLNEDEQVIKIAGKTVSAGTFTKEQAAALVQEAFEKGSVTSGTFTLTTSDVSPYILTSAINRFYEDGKYSAMYFAYDDTSRGKPQTLAGSHATSIYDKRSNLAEIVFYVLGEGSVPWIESIKTNPAKPTENSSFIIAIEVGDAEKDELSLTAEVYLDRQKIHTQRWAGLNANASGSYPLSTTTQLDGNAGTYDVVCTVRDSTGVGFGSYQFKIRPQGRIEGMVAHTPNWEANRKAYNMSKFGTEYNEVSNFTTYLALSNPRRRGTNVFWAGEAFCLSAYVAGEAVSVACEMSRSEENAQRTKRASGPWVVTLRRTAEKNAAGEWLYVGRFDDPDFRLLGQAEPEEVQFRFTSTYAGGRTKEDIVSAIVDNTRPYELMHRIY